MSSYCGIITYKRKKFLKANKNKSYTTIEGANHVLISAPHGVPQVRLGKNKLQEIGSLGIALYVAEKTGSFLIAKTKNNFDDANFDEVSDYKDECYRLIKEHDIKYVIDFHGLDHKRHIDINLGTHLGHNVETNTKLIDELERELKTAFLVNIDQPYMASANTVSSSCKRQFPYLWTLQVEVDYMITNRQENDERLNKLIDILVRFINGLK